MKIGPKLIVVFVVSLASLSLVGLVASVGLGQMAAQTDLMFDRNTRTASALLAVSQDFFKMRLAVRDFLLGRDPGLAPDFRSKLDALQNSLKADLDAYSQAAGGDQEVGNNTFAGFNASLTAYRTVVDRILDRAAAKDFAGALTLLQDDGALAARDMGYQLDGLSTANDQSASDRHDRASALAAQATVAIAVSAGVAALILLFLSLWLARNLGLPLTSTAGVARRLASGDLTEGIPPGIGRRRDEVGTLAQAVGELAMGLGTFVSTLQSTGATLTQTAATLDDRAEAAQGSAAQVVAVAEDGQGSARRQADRSRTVAETARTLATTVDSFAALIEDQSSSVTETSASIHQMSATIRNLHTRSQGLNREFGLLRSLSDDGREKLYAMVDKVEAIARQSEHLAEANRLIGEIAAQTNLLSMNAAIEAAHAGQAGAGFSVVADEIRKLAELAAEHSRQITKEVATIDALAATASTDSDTAKEAFASVLAQIDGLGRFETELTGALQEQAQGAQQILEATEHMTEITGRVQQGSEGLRSGTETIASEVEVVHQLSEELARGLDRIVAEGRTIRQNAEALRQDAAGNRTSAAELTQLVSGYRTK